MRKINKGRNKILSLLIIIIIFTAGIAAYLFIFNIYEVTFSTSSKNLIADNHSTIKIDAIPINAMGWHVPFRSVDASYEFVSGKELVTIIEENKKSGLLILKAKNKTGGIIIKTISSKTLLPSLIELNISSNKK